MKLLILTSNRSLNRPSYRLRIADNLPYLEAEGVHCRVEKLPKNLIRRMNLYRQANDYDAVLLHRKLLTFFDTMILRNVARKIILDYDDAIMFNPNKSSYSQSILMKRFIRTAKISNLIIAGNQYLAHQGQKYCNQLEIIPTGLDVHAFDSYVQKDETDVVRLVWIGSRSTLKYLKEITSVLEIIGSKYQNVSLRIISDTFIDLQHMKIEKVNWSQEQQCKQIAECDIGLAPLSDDPFTRGKCGFKILQYAAASLPCVTSPVGINNDFVQDKKTGFHADSESEWITALETLIQEENLRTTMGKAARVFSEHYDMEIIGKHFSQIIKGFLKS